MPWRRPALGPQPRRARGTLEHPDSAITLRAVLAVFGLVVCVAGWLIFWHIGYTALAFVLLALAVVALIDLVVLGARIRHR